MGATGLVGTEMLRILEERAFPVDELRAVRVAALARAASCRSPAARSTCEVLRDGCFDGLDLVIVDVDDPLALEWAPQAAAAGATVVDNSAAFRMDPDVPLVVAEVNPDDLRDMPKGIASCPNCTTMVPVTALAPLHRAARHRPHGRVDLPVGLGRRAGRHARARRAVDEARRAQSETLRRAGALDGAARARARCGTKPIAGNVIPLAGSVKEAGYTSEEWKMVRETPQDPPRRRDPRAPSRACACRCTSATRCRPTCGSTAR